MPVPDIPSIRLVPDVASQQVIVSRTDTARDFAR